MTRTLLSAATLAIGLVADASAGTQALRLDWRDDPDAPAYELAGVENGLPFVIRNSERFTIPEFSGVWNVEGSVRETAALLDLSPVYELRREILPDPLAPPSFKAQVTVMHRESSERLAYPSRILQHWQPADLENASLLFGWVFEDRILFPRVRRVEPTRELRYLISETFTLDAGTMNGIPVVGLIGPEGLIAPKPRFRDKMAEAAYHAIMTADLPRLKSLLAQGLNPNRRGREGVHLIHLAAEAGNPEILRLLLAHGARASSRTLFDSTAVTWAAKSGREQAVRILIEARANLNEGRPLTDAIKMGHSGTARLLIEAGASPSLSDYNEDTPLDLALIYGLPDIAGILVAKRARLSLGTTSLLRIGIGYAGLGNTAMLRHILDQGADPNGIDDNQSMLLVAVQSGMMDAVGLLLERGADPSQPNKEGVTPLMMAALWNRPAIAGRLIEAGADPEVETADAINALHMAAHRGHPEVVACLLDHGASWRRKTAVGRTALDIALLRGMSGCASILASHGAALDVAGPEAQSLIVAAIREDLDALIRSAIGQGWNPDSVLIENRSAAEIAFLYEAGKTLDLLRERSAKPIPLPPVHSMTELTSVPQPSRPVHLVDPRGGQSVFPEVCVTVAGIIDAEGRAGFARVTSCSDRQLIPVALEAFDHARFSPPLLGDTPVAIRVSFPIVFPRKGIETWDYQSVDDPPQPLDVKRLVPKSKGFAPTGGPTWIEYIIDRDGSVRDPQVIGPDSRPIEGLSVDELLAWRFSPGLVDGKPVAVRIVTSVDYLLSERWDSSTVLWAGSAGLQPLWGVGASQPAANPRPPIPDPNRGTP